MDKSNSTGGRRILSNNKDWKYLLFSIACVFGALFSIYIVYDVTVTFIHDFQEDNSPILLPWGYQSLYGAALILYVMGVGIWYEKVSKQAMSEFVLRSAKYTFIFGLIAMVLVPVVFRYVSIYKLESAQYVHCFGISQKGVGAWSKDKQQCP